MEVYVPEWGESLNTTIERIVALAWAKKEIIKTEHNGISFKAEPGSSFKAVIIEYENEKRKLDDHRIKIFGLISKDLKTIRDPEEMTKFIERHLSYVKKSFSDKSEKEIKMIMKGDICSCSQRLGEEIYYRWMSHLHPTIYKILEGKEI